MARSRTRGQGEDAKERGDAPVATQDRERRLAVVRDRLERGFYHTEWVIRQVAIRLLASGDIDRAA